LKKDCATFEKGMTGNKKAIVAIAFLFLFEKLLFLKQVFKRDRRPAFAFHFDNECNASGDQTIAFRDADTFYA